MNQHEEELLRSLPLRAPGTALDARIDQLVAASRADRVPRGRSVRLWQCVAACAACAAIAFGAGLLMPRRAQQAPAGAAATEVRYVVQVEPGPYNVFDWTTYPKNMAPAAQRSTPPVASDLSDLSDPPDHVNLI